MLTKEQIKQVEHSFKHGDGFVFVIEDRGVFVADRVLKHRKEATVEMRDCAEVDETCFGPNGEYDGDITNAPLKNFILDDPYADYDNTVASIYYSDEIKEVF